MTIHGKGITQAELFAQATPTQLAEIIRAEKGEVAK